MSVLYIVRHGQASFASANYDRLSWLGLQQAALLADYFEEHDLHFDHLYSGTLERQIETARPVQAYHLSAGRPVELIQRNGFNEFNFSPVLNAYVNYLAEQQPSQSVVVGELMQDKHLFQLFYDNAMQAWIRDLLVDTQIEPWLQFKQRVVNSFCHMLAESRGTVLLVTSGGVIGLLMQHVLGVSDRKAINLSSQVFNSAVTKLYYNRDGDISLGSFNTLPHLGKSTQRELVSYR